MHGLKKNISDIYKLNNFIVGRTNIFSQITSVSFGSVKSEIMATVKDMGLNGCCSKFSDNP